MCEVHELFVFLRAISTDLWKSGKRTELYRDVQEDLGIVADFSVFDIVNIPDDDKTMNTFGNSEIDNLYTHFSCGDPQNEWIETCQ